MRRYAWVGLLAVVGFACLVITACNDSNPSKPPVAGPTELEGTWSGTNTDGIDQTAWVFVFSTNTVSIKTINLIDTTETIGGTFSLDTTASPKSISIHVLRSPGSTQRVGKTILGSYVLSANVLTITANIQTDSLVIPTPAFKLFQQ